MNKPIDRTRPLRFALAVLLLTAAGAAPAPVHADDAAVVARADTPAVAPRRPAVPRLDRSGHRRTGMASYYAQRFAGRRMADGTPMRPESNNAASTTLPLGTVARVTHLGNGRSALVTIRDRGPFAKGRIIDLSPRTASHLGMIEAGVARVEVTPLILPRPALNAAVVLQARSGT